MFLLTLGRLKEHLIWVSGVNGAGESFGIGGSSESGEDPVVVLAEVANGRIGYARSTDR